MGYSDGDCVPHLSHQSSIGDKEMTAALDKIRRELPSYMRWQTTPDGNAGYMWHDFLDGKVEISVIALTKGKYSVVLRVSSKYFTHSVTQYLEEIRSGHNTASATVKRINFLIEDKDTATLIKEQLARAEEIKARLDAEEKAREYVDSVRYSDKLTQLGVRVHNYGVTAGDWQGCARLLKVLLGEEQ